MSRMSGINNKRAAWRRAVLSMHYVLDYSGCSPIRFRCIAYHCLSWLVSYCWILFGSKIYLDEFLEVSLASLLFFEVEKIPVFSTSEIISLGVLFSVGTRKSNFFIPRISFYHYAF